MYKNIKKTSKCLDATYTTGNIFSKKKTRNMGEEDAKQLYTIP
jgi:hypothetical protein